jgi:hypothetical protein
MLYTRVLCAVLLAGFSVVSAGCHRPDVPEDNTPTELLQRNGLPKSHHDYQSCCNYVGVVAAAGDDWVELAAGWEWFAPGLEDVPLLGKLGDDKKPKRISAKGTFLGGKKDEGPDTFDLHTLSDLKVGDKVMVHVIRTSDLTDWAVAVVITRRPGGKIPPGRDQMFGFRNERVTEGYQADQDWEEKGIPIPAKYLLEGRAHWTNPPYPPVAPQPREVKP